MKKEYIKPETLLIKLHQQAALLVASQLYDDPTDEIDDEAGVI